MSEPRYSVSEIDSMRASLQRICRDDRKAEDQLRTYMLNGTSPEELQEAARVAMEKRAEDFQRSMELQKLYGGGPV